MLPIVLQDNGKIRNVDDIELAEEVVAMRAKKDPWEVIDKLLAVWAKNAPDEVEAVVVNVDQYRSVQNDQEFAQTNDGKQFDRRFKLAFPRSLMLMIRTQYKADELPMDSKFFTEFGQRYPVFRVAQKD
jgi:hypothetical protein